jgi:hypothetical protein
VHAQRACPFDRGEVDDLEAVERREVRGVRRAADELAQVRPADADERAPVRVGLRDLEGADADVEAAALGVLLDEPRVDERLQQAVRDRLLQPGAALDVGEAQRRALLGQEAQDRERALDRLDALALVFRITGRRSDDRSKLARGPTRVKRRRRATCSCAWSSRARSASSCR